MDTKEALEPLMPTDAELNSAGILRLTRRGTGDMVYIMCCNIFSVVRSTKGVTTVVSISGAIEQVEEDVPLIMGRVRVAKQAY